MRTARPLLLALASFSAAVLAEDTFFTHRDLSKPVGNEHLGNLNLAGMRTNDLNKARGSADLASERYPLPEPQCGSWVGIEVIFMVEVTEVCPEGSTGKTS